MKKVMCTLLAAGTFAALAHGANINLSSWSPLTLDFAGGQPAGNWQLQPGNESVIQTVNADPSFFLNNLNQTAFSIDGTWRVNESGGDDDYMGFAFGYQNSSNFYLFDWKQGGQSYEGRTGAEGMTIKKFTGGTGNGLVDLSLAELWENQVNFSDMSVLATNHGSTLGWADNTLYNFHLDFNTVPGQFSIEVKQGATTLWNTTVFESTFSGGQFGFYNYSQQNVEYAGFTQRGGVIVTPPSGVPDSGTSLALFSAVLAGLALVGRRGKP